MVSMHMGIASMVLLQAVRAGGAPIGALNPDAQVIAFA